jgi:hypothetical protein
MKRTQREAAQLEAELLRLNSLVRERRSQLARLEACPNKDCECRRVWKEVVEKKLSQQVGKIRKQVRGKSGAKPKPKRRPPGSPRKRRS